MSVILSFCIGFIVGGVYCISIWQSSTKRGHYELIGKLWKVEEIKQ